MDNKEEAIWGEILASPLADKSRIAQETAFKILNKYCSYYPFPHSSHCPFDMEEYYQLIKDSDFLDGPLKSQSEDDLQAVLYILEKLLRYSRSDDPTDYLNSEPFKQYANFHTILKYLKEHPIISIAIKDYPLSKEFLEHGGIKIPSTIISSSPVLIDRTRFLLLFYCESRMNGLKPITEAKDKELFIKDAIDLSNGTIGLPSLYSDSVLSAFKSKKEAKRSYIKNILTQGKCLDYKAKNEIKPSLTESAIPTLISMLKADAQGQNLIQELELLGKDPVTYFQELEFLDKDPVTHFQE